MATSPYWNTHRKARGHHQVLSQTSSSVITAIHMCYCSHPHVLLQPSPFYRSHHHFIAAIIICYRSHPHVLLQPSTCVIAAIIKCYRSHHQVLLQPSPFYRSHPHVLLQPSTCVIARDRRLLIALYSAIILFKYSACQNWNIRIASIRLMPTLRTRLKFVLGRP